MRIASLQIYPVKGCRGHGVESITLDQFGVVGDRRLMVVDAARRFVSQREEPRLATLQPTRHDNVLTVEQAGTAPLVLELNPTGIECDVTVWSDTIRAIDQGDTAAAWLSAALGTAVRLVAWGASSRRRLDATWAPTASVETAFTDGYPLLGVVQESLDDLNRRLEQPVPMARFRPTLVVDGGTPWCEDDWTAIRIGEVTLDAVKPCARCVVTTTDQQSGARHPHQEPLRTLASFRTIRGLGAIFGQNLVHREVGSIVTGAAVVP